MKKLLVLLLTLTPNAFASIWYVDGVNGNDTNDCRTRQNACKTIGHAISLASAGDTIGVGPATYSENLNINISLKLIGSGAGTIIDGGGVNTVVTISIGAANVVLSKFTIRNGNNKAGGGIYNQGTLTIHDSTVSGNEAGGFGRIPLCGGGGIYNAGTLTIYASTINSNRALIGGGICNAGTLTINGSTLSGNSAGPRSYCDSAGVGGGIENFSGALVINDSTLTGNTAMSSYGDYCPYFAYGGGISYHGGGVTINNSTISNNSIQGEYGGFGGGINGTATLQNSIVADNPMGGNCYGGRLTSKGYNLSSDNTCTFNGLGDLNNTNPLLGPLQNNGGPTQTQALLPGSPAIDAGNPNGCTDGSGHLLKTDARGAPRPDREDPGGCDMGAYERQKD